jgi:hypothetical protein
MKADVIVVQAEVLFLLAGIGGIAAMAEPLPANIDVAAVRGAASVSMNGTDYVALHTGNLTGAGFIFKTASDSTIDLVLPDSGTVLRMLPDSELQFARLNRMPVGELTVSDTSLKLLKGSVIGAQHKLSAPSHFDIATSQATATIVGTQYVINAGGAVSVLEGNVQLDYQPHNGHGSMQVTVPAGDTFNPATGAVVSTDPAFLNHLVADINIVKDHIKTFKVDGATIVVQPEKPVSPVHGHHHHHHHDGDGDHDGDNHD